MSWCNHMLCVRHWPYCLQACIWMHVCAFVKIMVLENVIFTHLFWHIYLNCDNWDDPYSIQRISLLRKWQSLHLYFYSYVSVSVCQCHLYIKTLPEKGSQLGRICTCRYHNTQRRGAIDGKTNHLMASSNGNFFRVTGHLCGEFTGLRWISRTKARDAELWCFLWSAPE